MADALISFLLVEKLKKPFVSLKSLLFEENYARRTIIGKSYKCDEDKHRQQRPLLPKIQRIHGYDIEANLRTWDNTFVVSYGPLYTETYTETWKDAKDEAWKHVLKNSNDEGGENETTRKYIEAVKRVEGESRALYLCGDHIPTNLKLPSSMSSDEQFIWIMILDGCFLLQIALLVLGGSKQLGYPVDHPIFGTQAWNKQHIRAAVSSMFLVGNQIPIVVLKELMKQSFFQNVFNQGIWKQPLDLERWVLFELLLVPMLDKRTKFIPTSLMRIYNFSARRTALTFPFGGYLIKSVISYLVERNLLRFWFKRKAPSQKADDLLHGLWLLMTGLANSRQMNAKIGLEDENECFHGYSSESSDTLPAVPSATELKEAGIVFKCSRGDGIHRLSFQKIMFNPVLFLPRIIIDHEIQSIELLFSNLIQYEVTQEFGESKRRICAYLQLMRELIRTPEDAKVLSRSGIIVVDPEVEKRLPEMFQGVWPNNVVPRVNTGTSLRKVRDQLINYAQPSMFKKLGDILSLVVFLTAIQTVYTVLPFYIKKHN